MKKTLIALVLLSIVAGLAACSGTAATPAATSSKPAAPASTAANTPTGPGKLVSIGSSLAGTEIRIGSTKPLEITASYDNGFKQVVTGKCTYKSGDESFVTVTPSGEFKGIAAGTTSITVSYAEGGVTQTLDIPVRVFAGFLNG